MLDRGRFLVWLCVLVSTTGCRNGAPAPRPAPTRTVDARVVGDVYRPLGPGPPSLDPEVVMQASAPAGALPQRLRALLELQRPTEVIDIVKTEPRFGDEIGVALSAAYLSLSSDSNVAENSAHAANAAIRVIGDSPTRPEAWFNRAVAVERLGLALSWQPWRDYSQKDPDPLWNAEATRRHIAGPIEWWAGFELRVLSYSSLDAATVRAAVRLHGDRVRALVEDQLIPAWASAVLKGDATVAAANLAQSTDLATILYEETHDPFIALHVQEVTSTADRTRARGIVAAALARRALGRGEISGSLPLLSQAGSDLTGCETAIALHQLSHGTAAYYRGDYANATDILSALVARAESQAWVSLAGRAAFALAAVAVRSANPGAADLNYRRAEAWLSSAGETSLLASAQAIHARQLHEQGDDVWAWELLRGAFGALPAITGATERYAIFNAAYRVALDTHLEGLAGELGLALDVEARRSGLAALISDAAAQRAMLHAELGQADSAERVLEIARTSALAVDDADVRAALVGLLDRVAADVLSAQRPCDAVPAYRRAMQSLSTRLAQYDARLYLALGRAQERCGAPAVAADSYRQGIESLEALLRTQSREALRISHQDRLWDLYGHLARIQVAKLGAPEEALRTVLRGRHMVWSDKTARNAHRVQALISPRLGQARLTFLVMPDETFLWHTTNAGSRFVRVAVGHKQLEVLVERWRQTLDSGRDDKQPSKDLFDRLLGGVSGLLEAPDLLLVQPDGPLYDLSFAALWTGDRYLVQVRPVWTLLGPLAPDADARGRGPGAVHALAVGDPAFSPRSYPRLSRLPGAAREARQVGGLYHAARVMLGADASAASVAAELQTADVVHIAAHAVANLASPDESRLVLADPGGDLSIAEIRKIHSLRARVVVLTACRSASGRIMRGSGALSVTHALTERLVPAAIGMLWDVGDDDSIMLATELHRRLAAGLGVAHALREAQLELLNNSAVNLRLPRVWAAAIGVGAPYVALSNGAPIS
jgi:CHAT domain-containing protein